jgi:hypothetical protein
MTKDVEGRGRDLIQGAISEFAGSRQPPATSVHYVLRRHISSAVGTESWNKNAGSK